MWMMGQLYDEVVDTRAQRRVQTPFGRESLPDRQILPPAFDQMQLRKGGMKLEHVAGLGIYERVYFDPGIGVLEHREHRRAEQHVSVVAQLDHQRAPQSGNIDRVGGAVMHAVHDSRNVTALALGARSSMGKSPPDRLQGASYSRYSAVRRKLRSRCGYALKEVPAPL